MITAAVIPAKAGYPVRRGLSVTNDCLGVLDHPLSRVMTVELVVTTGPTKQKRGGWPRRAW